MSKDKSKGKKKFVSIPTSPKTFLGFIDILFGVLLAYIISEVPVEDFKSQAATIIIVFLVLYITNTIKMFLHWWSLHFDLPIAIKYVNRDATLTHYIGALFACAGYIVFSKFIFLWFKEPLTNQWMLNVVFIIIIGFRVFDIVTNSIFMPRLVKRGLKIEKDMDKDDAMMVREWYIKDHPKIYPIYLLHISLSLCAILIPRLLLIFIVAYLFAEVLIEIALYKGRKKLFHIFD